MSTALILACLWAVLATVTAFLPMRAQYVPGFALLLAAPVLLVWIGIDHGPAIAVLGALGFVSMFRRPLCHLARLGLGRGRGESAGPAKRGGDGA